MFAKLTHRATLGAFAATIVTAGAWTLPSSTSSTPATAEAPAHAAQAMSVDINVPLNGIQDGQFCQAYALVYKYSGNLDFEWSGQFDNSDGSWGPLGEDQIVSGYVSESRDQWLQLVVEDGIGQVDTAWVSLNISSSNSYNSSCEA